MDHPLELLVQSIETLLVATEKHQATDIHQCAVYDALEQAVQECNKKPAASTPPIGALSPYEANFMRFVIDQAERKLESPPNSYLDICKEAKKKYEQLMDAKGLHQKPDAKTHPNTYSGRLDRDAEELGLSREELQRRADLNIKQQQDHDTNETRANERFENWTCPRRLLRRFGLFGQAHPLLSSGNHRRLGRLHRHRPCYIEDDTEKEDARIRRRLHSKRAKSINPDEEKPGLHESQAMEWVPDAAEDQDESSSGSNDSDEDENYAKALDWDPAMDMDLD